MSRNELLNTGEFARRAGVTVRTLRYYDRMGLLSPQRTEAGHRVYGAEDLVRLQQVLTLKLIGFSLSEIRRVLESPQFDLARALRAQRQVLNRKAWQISGVVRAIDAALAAVSEQTLDMERFAQIIEAMQMEEQNNWTKQYYTEEQQAKIAERAKDWTPELQAKAEAEWAAIFAEAKRLASAGADPAGPEGQALGAQMQSMIDQFTGGDKGIEEGLGRMWADRDNVPEQYRMGDEESGEFLAKVMRARSSEK